MDTVTLTIDGRSITVAKGTTVLQAAIENGIQIPYYCYHPALGIDGSCRVCIVKIEKMPKLQTSCSTAVRRRHGGRDARRPRWSRRAPACSSSCSSTTRSTARSATRAASARCRTTPTPSDPTPAGWTSRAASSTARACRADVDFGPTLMLNRNRCILCTRCVRFMRDIDGDAQIGVAGPRLRQPDRDVPGRGRALAAQRQPDGRVPGRRASRRATTGSSRGRGTTRWRSTRSARCARRAATPRSWLKAKPEWAKGPRLARMTPRLQPARSTTTGCATSAGSTTTWSSRTTGSGSRCVGRERARCSRRAGTTCWPRCARRRAPRGASRPCVPRLGARLARGAGRCSARSRAALHGDGAEQQIGDQLAGEREATAERDEVHDAARGRAQRARGALDLGLGAVRWRTPPARPTWPALRRGVEAGQVGALYVFDPGPAGSIGDVSWVIEARARGPLQLLVVQGVLMTDLAAAADLVLPGATLRSRRTPATPTSRGCVQAASQAVAPPGDAMEDWQILRRTSA